MPFSIVPTASAQVWFLQNLEAFAASLCNVLSAKNIQGEANDDCCYLCSYDFDKHGLSLSCWLYKWNCKYYFL